MPESAQKALSGLLKDGATAEEAIKALEEEGFGITPPEGDMSYGESYEGDMPSEEKPEGMMAISMTAEPEEYKEGEKYEEEEGNPGYKDGKREKAAKKAMSKHGYKY